MRNSPSIVCGLFLAACAWAPAPSTALSGASALAPVNDGALAPATTTAPAATTAPAREAPQQDPRAGLPRTRLPSSWRPGDVTLQGFLGASFFELSTEGASPLEDEDATFPTIGGGAQWKVAGDRLDFGFEGLLQFAWNGDISAFVSTGAGTAVAVDVNLLVFDLYGGPFVNCMLGGKARAYAGAGPVLRWGSYDQDGPSNLASGDGDGFGVGYYARAGLEFEVSRNSMVGFAARWSAAEMDLSGRLGDLDLNGLDLVITVTQGF